MLAVLFCDIHELKQTNIHVVCSLYMELIVLTAFLIHCYILGHQVIDYFIPCSTCVPIFYIGNFLYCGICLSCFPFVYARPSWLLQ